MKSLLKKVLLKAGFEIKRYTPINSVNALMRKIILQNKTDLLIDVGANSGQYGKLVRELGYEGDIISFEPIKSVFENLKSNANYDKNWRTENFAIGIKEEEALIHISENTFSSSILDIKDAHVSAAPESRYVSQERIRVMPLDKFITTDILNSHNSIMLKIDVQGYEMNVIDGAVSLLPSIKIVQAELSFLPMYSNGPLYKDVITRMDSLGFELFSLIPEFIDPNSGRLLQADGIFFNRKMLDRISN